MISPCALPSLSPTHTTPPAGREVLPNWISHVTYNRKALKAFLNMSYIDSLVDASTGCSRLFLDGGTNTGEHVEAFLKGSFHRCAIASPNRLYGKAWKNASALVRKHWMQVQIQALARLAPHNEATMPYAVISSPPTCCLAHISGLLR